MYFLFSLALKYTILILLGLMVKLPTSFCVEYTFIVSVQRFSFEMLRVDLPVHSPTLGNTVGDIIIGQCQVNEIHFRISQVWAEGEHKLQKQTPPTNFALNLNSKMFEFSRNGFLKFGLFQYSFDFYGLSALVGC